MRSHMRIDGVKVGEEYEGLWGQRFRVLAIERVQEPYGWRGSQYRNVRKPKVQRIDTSTGEEVGEPRLLSHRDLRQPWAQYAEQERARKEQRSNYLAVSGRLLAALDHAGIEMNLSESHFGGVHAYLGLAEAQRLTQVVEAGAKVVDDDE